MPKTKFQQNELTKKWIQSYRSLSKTRGLSQLKLQKDIGMNQSFISQILNNRVNFPAKYLDKYCRKYHVNINSLSAFQRPVLLTARRGRTSSRPLPLANSQRITGGGSIDKMLASLKDAFSKRQNGSSVNIVTANRILNNVSTKLASLQSDISDIQNALGGPSVSRSRGRRGRK